MAWQLIAAKTGGTVAGLASATTNDCGLVFAATSTGVYRSRDAGRTWMLSGPTQPVPFAEAVAPSADFASDRMLFVCARDGLYRSGDGGESWQQVLVGSRMLGVASAHGGLVVVGTETDGVLRSEDSGRSWTGANAGLLDLTALAVALSPCFEEDRVGFVGTASGLYRTRNGARSWRAVETGLEDPAVQCLALSPSFADDRLVLAGTESDGLLVSHDAGASWRQVLDGGVTALAFATRQTIAAATESGIAVSHDGGESWQRVGPGPGPVLGLTFIDDVLLAGVDRLGVARSNDGGATWHASNDGLHAHLPTALALASDGTLFAATLEDGVRISTDRGQTWRKSNAGLDDAAVYGLAISPDFAHDATAYAATVAGVYVSRDTGSTWAPSPGPAQPARLVAAGPSRVLAAYGVELHVSNDRAGTWRSLHGFDAEVVSVSHTRDGAMFVATGQAAELVLWRSLGEGQRWERWLVERGADILPIAVSPGYALGELVFVGLNGRVLKPLRHTREVRAGEKRPLWRSAELQGAAAITALAVSPGFDIDRTIVAATNAGVFVSRDAGDTFAPWSEGLTPPGMVAVALSTDGLAYALGLGGTLWRRPL